MKQQISKIKEHLRLYSRLTLLTLTMLAGTTFIADAKQPDKKEPAASIVFIEGKANEAIKKAAGSDKYVFVDLQASWCGPCRLLKEKVFTDKRVADFFNSHFVNLSIDVEKDAGPKLAKKWKVEGLPTLLVLDAKGNVVKRTVGYIDADHLLAFANEIVRKK